MKFKYGKKEEISEIPKTTGVYSFWSGKTLLYIGKAGNLRERVKTHFMQPNYRDNLFINQVDKIGYIETPSEIEALLSESALIKQELPKYNVLWKDGKNYFFIAITNEELPLVFLTHQPSKEKTLNTKYQIPNTRYIGPFVDGKTVRRTLRVLRRVFPYYTLRRGSGQAKHEKKPCQYCHLGLCPGPAPDIQGYRKNIKNLVAVLEGKKPAVLKKLKREMTAASRNQEYEKAGALRDQLQDLEMIFSQAKVFRSEEQKAPGDWPGTENYLRKILRTKKRISRVEAYDISNIQGKEATGSMPVFISGMPAKDHYRKFRIKIAGKANDFAMLQEVLTRRLAHTEWPYPDLMIIDGGRGQLSSALKVISNQQLPILVAAIAKKHNELFLPGKAKPLLLHDMPQNVSNFILHMRDEAHRFAISYHRTLLRSSLLQRPSPMHREE